MGHAKAKLTVFSRQLIVDRVAAGWPAAEVADQLGISRATAYKWLRRFREEGPAGLLDRSCRPHRSPRHLSDAAEAEILAARMSWRYGPDRLGPLLGRPASTVHRVLERRGVSRMRDADRVTLAPVRYVHDHPRLAAAPGSQEAGPHPRRRWASCAGPGWQHRARGWPRGLRPHRGHRRRHQPLCHGGAGAR